MTVRHEYRDRIRSLLQRDSEAVASLRTLLLDEREALAARDLARLNETVQRKLECVALLERQEQERRDLLRIGRSRDWNALLATVDPALLDTWKELGGALREVADLSAANEKIVTRARHATQRLLGLMRGQGPEPASVYDKLGRARSVGDNRAITSA